MANNYYSSENPYQGQGSFLPPPVQQPYNPPPYSSPPRGSDAGSAYYGAPAPSHQYQPRDDSPRYRGTPPPPNMQVAPYQGYADADDYPPSHHHSHHSRDPYDEPNPHYHPGHHHHHDDYSDERPREGLRGSVDHHEVERSRGSVSGGHHGNTKKVGAALAGAAIGGLAGHEVGHGGVATIIGALAGGFAGEKLEKRHEKHKEEAEEKRELKRAHGPPRHRVGPYAPGGAFSDVGSDSRSSHVSRRHDRSPSYSDESGSDYEGGRRHSRR